MCGFAAPNHTAIQGTFCAARRLRLSLRQLLDGAALYGESPPQGDSHVAHHPVG